MRQSHTVLHCSHNRFRNSAATLSYINSGSYSVICGNNSHKLHKDLTFFLLLRLPPSDSHWFPVGTSHRTPTVSTEPWVDVRSSPVAAPVCGVISQTLITSTITSRAPFLPMCAYRSLILGMGGGQRRVTVRREIATQLQVEHHRRLTAHKGLQHLYATHSVLLH